MRACTRTIIYNIPGQSSLTRVIDHVQDNLQRNKGYILQTSGSSPIIEQTVTYDYSIANGRFGSVSDGANTFTYGYTANSNLISSVVGPVHTVTNGYYADRNVLLTKTNQRASINSIISTVNYNVNSIGQRIEAERIKGISPVNLTVTSTNTDYGYDNLGQVSKANSEDNLEDRIYEYDGIGNRLKSADSLTSPTLNNYTPNALNQYTAVNTFAPTYDVDGNQKDAQIKPTSTGVTTSAVFFWDAENRLLEAKDSSAVTVVKHYYDGQSRKIATAAGSTTTYYVYNGWNCIAEYTGSSPTLAKTQLWGLDLSGSMQGAGGVGGLLSITDHDTTITTHFPCYDGNGNITEYINQSATIVAHYQYDPFGNTIVATGDNAADFAYRFSTKPIDTTTGLYYYGYRYFDPITGRWPSRDPIEERGGLNLYAFVNNQGVNEIDVLGRINLMDETLNAFQSLVSERIAGCYDGSIRLGPPIWVAPAAAFLQFHLYGVYCIKPCCDNEEGDTDYIFEITGGIEAFLQWGHTLQWDSPNHAKTQPNKGYRDRSGHFDINARKTVCPKQKFGFTDWSVKGFLRGTVGAGVGAQGAIEFTIAQGNFDPNSFWDRFNANASLAWGVLGLSIELGINGSAGAYGVID